MKRQILSSIALWTAAALPLVVAAQPVKPDGKQVFDQWCAACHGPSMRLPGTASLAAKYGNSMPAALEERDNLNPAFVRYFVRNGISVMPPFRKTEISDAELDALGAYLTRPPAK